MATAFEKAFTVGKDGDPILFQTAETDRLVTVTFARSESDPAITLISAQVYLPEASRTLLTISGNNTSNLGDGLYTVPVSDMSATFAVGGTGAEFKLRPVFSDGPDEFTVSVKET